MKRKLDIKNLINNYSIWFFVKTTNSKEGRLISSLGIALFLLALHASDDSYAYDDAKYGKVCRNLLKELGGDFGSLLTAAAGLGAVVASAAGGFKIAWSLVVVAVGSYTLKTYQEIWFDEC